MIEGWDYFVRLVDFPTCACGGVVMLNSDNTYTILLNSRLSEQQKRSVIAHELRHIKNGDFHRAASVEQMESEAG